MKAKLYNIDKYIRSKTNDTQKAFYDNQECIIFEGKHGVVVAYFDCKYFEFESLDDASYLEMLYVGSDDKSNHSHDSAPFTLRELTRESPYREIDTKRFFHKRDATFRDQKKFISLMNTLRMIGVDITDL
jgi:hypothetical protein